MSWVTHNLGFLTGKIKGLDEVFSEVPHGSSLQVTNSENLLVTSENY